jgi:hypothetical protein
MKVIELPDQSSTATKQQPSVIIHAKLRRLKSVKKTLCFVFLCLFLGCHGLPVKESWASGKILKHILKKSKKQGIKSTEEVLKKLEQARTRNRDIKNGLLLGSPHGLKHLFQCNNSDRFARASTRVNVRETGSLKGTRIGTLDKGRRVCVRQRNNDYFYTQYGWVSGRYLIAE